MAVIEVTDLHKAYRPSWWKVWQDREPTHALQGVDFSVEAGEVFGIVGPNGAGKTTLINILSGLLYKDTGSVKIFGDETRENREDLAQRMNVATAYSGLSANLTVEENLKIFAKLYSVAEARDKIDEVLETFQITELRHKPIRALSAGQKTRANLAKSFINEPELLLLDEATAGLDPHISAVTRDAIKDLNQRYGTTIIITSHKMADIDALSDRMLFLHNGTVLRTGTPQALKKDIHVKVLNVTVAEATDTFAALVAERDGTIDGATARFTVDAETEIIDILDAISDLDITVIDIEATNPDLDDVFNRVAEGQL